MIDHLIGRCQVLEGFFEELGTGLAQGRNSDDIRAALAGKYDSIPAPTNE